MLLSTAYFPNVHYLTKVHGSKTIYLEGFENYQKQSYRNRCTIYAANGVMNLTVPIEKGRTPGISIKDIRIDYAMPWQKNHLRSIVSAYTHSPFYEFYMDDLLVLFEKRERFLFDFNLKILEILLDLVGIKTEISITPSFQDNQDIENDWRTRIHPKIDYSFDTQFKPIDYPQNFEHKKGFQSNLSIIDTLFQLGPETLKYIDDCVPRI